MSMNIMKFFNYYSVKNPYEENFILLYATDICKQHEIQSGTVEATSTLFY
jgi:hypothetical protein